MGSSGGIAESNNRSSRTTRIQSTRSTTSGGGEGDKSYLCKWRDEARRREGGLERVNDSLETGGARNRTRRRGRGARASWYK